MWWCGNRVFPLRDADCSKWGWKWWEQIKSVISESACFWIGSKNENGYQNSFFPPQVNIYHLYSFVKHKSQPILVHLCHWWLSGEDSAALRWERFSIPGDFHTFHDLFVAVGRNSNTLSLKHTGNKRACEKSESKHHHMQEEGMLLGFSC